MDVDAVDSNDLVLGLGAEPGGLTSAQAHRIVDDVDTAADVVGLSPERMVRAGREDAETLSARGLARDGSVRHARR